MVGIKINVPGKRRVIYISSILHRPCMNEERETWVGVRNFRLPTPL